MKTYQECLQAFIDEFGESVDSGNTYSEVLTKPTKPAHQPSEGGFVGFVSGLNQELSGIVIDRPDHARMLAIIEEAARNVDRYAIEEREAIRAEPSTFPDLIGPYRTRWGTVVYSARDAEPIEGFGPTPVLM